MKEDHDGHWVALSFEKLSAEEVVHQLRHDLAEIADSKGKISPDDIRKYADYLYKKVVEWETTRASL